MKKLLFALFIFIFSLPLSAQQQGTTTSLPGVTPGTTRVYAELVGYQTNLLGLNKNVMVEIDLGQYQSTFKSQALQDENGKTLKFNSMVAAMNYMGDRGWTFVQVYAVNKDDTSYYHWLMYKDVTDKSQIFDGLKVSGK